MGNDDGPHAGIVDRLPGWKNRRRRCMLTPPDPENDAGRRQPTQEIAMAKGLNQKKTEKKKPEKSLKEKRADKANKKAGK
ncbi:MAG: hypothetical protein NT046_04105 [Arenimonas sp.]|nr:hypothetical protein [Arenimonas sp.]